MSVHHVATQAGNSVCPRWRRPVTAAIISGILAVQAVAITAQPAYAGDPAYVGGAMRTSSPEGLGPAAAVAALLFFGGLYCLGAGDCFGGEEQERERQEWERRVAEEQEQAIRDFILSKD